MTGSHDAHLPAHLPAEGSASPQSSSTEEHPAWRRVHPLTPVLRGWLIFVAVIGAILVNSQDLLREIIGALVTGRESQTGHWLGERPWMIAVILGGLVLLLALIFFFGWLDWRFTRFRVEGDVVVLRKGVLTREQKQARLDRVQSVDITQTLIARLLGFASLKFDVAGGTGSSVDISFLTKKQAEELREEMLGRVRRARAAARAGTPGTTPATTAAAPCGTADHLSPAPLGSPGEAGDPEATAPEARGGASGTEVGGAPGTGDSGAAGDRIEPAVAHRTGTNLGTRLAARLQLDLSGTVDTVAADFGDTITEFLAPYGVVARTDESGEFLRVPAHRVLLSKLVSPTTVVLLLAVVVLFVGAGILMATVDTEAGLSMLIPSLLGIGGAAFAHVKGAFDQANFRVRLTEDGLAVERGLTNTTRKVIPLSRLQSVEVCQPLLWRRFGWWLVRFNTAGGADTSSAGSDNVLLPVGTFDEALLMLGLALPEPEDDARALFTRAMLADAAPEAAEVEPRFRKHARSSRWLDPLTWKRNGYVVTPTFLLIRSGRLHRSAIAVPHARVQSMALRRGPLEKRLGLANVHLHSTAGPVHARVNHLAAADAEELFYSHAETTRLARAELDGRLD